MQIPYNGINIIPIFITSILKESTKFFFVKIILIRIEIKQIKGLGVNGDLASEKEEQKAEKNRGTKN